MIESKAKPVSRGTCRYCHMSRQFGGGVGIHVATASEVAAQAMAMID